MSALNRLGTYISTEQGFLRATMIGLGVPAAVLSAWAFDGDGQGISFFMMLGALIGTYLWGLAMWRLMLRDIYARKREAASKSTAPPALADDRDR